MSNRGLSFVSLLAVIGLSIVFGMVIGGRLNTPKVARAASEPLVRLAPAVTGDPAVRDFADVVEEALPAVVSVTSSSMSSGEDRSDEDLSPQEEFFRRFFPGQPDPHQRERRGPRIGEGSGFIISADGYLLTNNHVVESFDRIEVSLHDGREILATVVGTDPRIDLALLKIDVGDETLPSLPLGDSDQLRVGQWVIAIGNPLEFEHTVTVGVLSAKQRRVQIGGTDQGVVSFLQTDAAINFGNSGGPLLDAQGNVVGINTAIRRENLAEGIGFALPINNARNVMEQLREHGHVRRGWIGITMNSQGIDDAAREYYGLEDTRGVIIERVTTDGPAEEAGLERFDIIRRVDGNPVRDNLDLISKIASKQPGEEVELGILRDGKSRTLHVTLGDRDEGLDASALTRTPEREEPEGFASTGLGFTVEELSPSLRRRMQLGEDEAGVLVTDVEFESEAADKGITPMTIVSSINDRPVRDVGDWDEALGRFEPGDVVKVAGLSPRAEPFSVYLRVPEP